MKKRTVAARETSPIPHETLAPSRIGQLATRHFLFLLASTSGPKAIFPEVRGKGQNSLGPFADFPMLQYLQASKQVSRNNKLGSNAAERCSPLSTHRAGGIRANRSGNITMGLSIPYFTNEDSRSLVGTLLGLELLSPSYALQLAVVRKQSGRPGKPVKITRVPLHAIMQCYIPMAFSMNIPFYRLFSRDIAPRFETAFKDQLSCTLWSIE